MHPLATCNPARTRPRAGTVLLFALLAAALAGSARALDWHVEVTPAGELFPGLDLSQTPRAARAAVGGGNGLVSVSVRGADMPARLRLRIGTPGLRTEATVEAERPAGDDPVLVLYPRFDWDVAALRGLSGVRRQSLQVSLETDGRVETRRVELRLHPLDDAPYFVREGSDRVDLGWAFAGYVDPHDPVVDEVLAMARRIEPRFDAGGTDAALALRRAGAIWAALEQRGLRYDDSDPALSRGPAVWSQRVRLAQETWRDRHANCIDSSVLIAAAFERIGLRALIVLVPGHAFVGYRRGERDAEYFETTLLGAPAAAAANFNGARAAGRAHWRKVASRLDGRHGPDYALVDIGIARAYGIIPLGASERASPYPSEVSPATAAASRTHGLP